MWKKILASMLIATSILTFSPVGHAANLDTKNKSETKVEASKYEVISPEKDPYSIEDKVVLISGKAPEGTSVVIDVYGTADLTTKNFNLDKLPSEEDYISISSDTVKAGNMGFFKKQIDLVMGINKVVITFKVDNVSPIEKIIYVSDKGKAEEEIKSTKDKSTTDALVPKK